MGNMLKLLDYEVMFVQDAANEIPTGVAMIKAPDFWAKGYYGQGVTIAIIDTGIQTTHPDLKDRIIGGRNFTTDDNSNPNIFEDYNGHGTHVAGTIAASQNNAGVVGVAPKANLLILKALNRYGSGTYESVVSAIQYAISQKVDIISMSLGGPVPNTPLANAIKTAVQNGISVVCAASNSGDGNAQTNEFAYPGSYPEVISVGAQTAQRTVASFSNSNNQVDLIAPGVQILSTYLNSRYAALSGTSMAAPHVSGALALIKNWGIDKFGRNLTELESYGQLIRRAVSVGLPKTLEGNGILFLTAQDLLENLIKTVQ